MTIYEGENRFIRLYNLNLKQYVFVMYVSLCGLSPVGCNRDNFSENDPKAAANPELRPVSAKHPVYKM